MSSHAKILGLDIGAARIGVALGDGAVRIAIPHGHIDVDGNEVTAIAEIALKNDIDRIIIGYPRNQSGEPTAQTASVESFAAKLSDLDVKIIFQDESLTSVIAEQRLISRGAPYGKGDIDSEAATIILQDYMEQQV